MLSQKIFPIFDTEPHRVNKLVDPKIICPTVVETEKDNHVYQGKCFETNYIGVGTIPNLISLCIPKGFPADITYEINPAIGIQKLLVEIDIDDKKQYAIINIGDKNIKLISQGNGIYSYQQDLVDKERFEVEYLENVTRKLIVTKIRLDVSFNRQVHKLTISPQDSRFSNENIKVIGVWLDIELQNNNRY